MGDDFLGQSDSGTRRKEKGNSKSARSSGAWNQVSPEKGRDACVSARTGFVRTDNCRGAFGVYGRQD